MHGPLNVKFAQPVLCLRFLHKRHLNKVAFSAKICYGISVLVLKVNVAGFVPTSQFRVSFSLLQ